MRRLLNFDSTMAIKSRANMKCFGGKKKASIYHHGRIPE
jgi:hypothetical protein